MIRAINICLALVLALGLAGCGQKGKFRTYKGPEVTSIIVSKSEREMQLIHKTRVLKTYEIALGFAPEGHKQFEGDGKTPEGTYFIDRQNPNSQFHLSLGISYPNDADRAFAEAADKKPGGDIFIHGHTGFKDRYMGDWTLGCIAVTDEEMEVIYSMVKVGTPIFIKP
ncbi:MAG: L,D-transpeptidase family protein [Pseudorhodobacter sp.]|nr:L,D-transpeptidase family protein [Pseudorhodobacter sp.]